MFNIFGCRQRNKAKFKTDNNNNNTADSPKGFQAGLNFNFIYLKLISVNRL